MQKIEVSEELYKEIKSYSLVTGVPVSQVLTDALTDWLETVGTARLEVLASDPPYAKLNLN